MKIIILGGGISSLSAALYARKKYPDAKISLFEKRDHVGGWIQTSHEEGFFFEQGPRTFAASRCPNLLSLIEETGLTDKIIYSNPVARRRFLWHGGKLRPTASFLPMLILPLLREPFIAKGKGDDESIYDFAVRRLGPSVTNTLIDALALGIYASDNHKLSVRSCFPFLYKWEQEWGSLVLGALFSKRKKGGKTGLFTLQNGMGDLIRKLTEECQAETHLNTPVEGIRQDGITAGGKFHPADLIVSGLNGSSIGKLTGLWSEFEETDIWIVHLAYRGDVLPKKGFGYLVPTQEGEQLLGMVWDSAIFPQQSVSGETRVTLMMRRGDVESATEIMQRHLNVTVQPVYSKVHLAKKAIPQFFVGYGKRLAHFQDEAKKKYPSLLLLGNYLRGASVDACIALAKEAFL